MKSYRIIGKCMVNPWFVWCNPHFVSYVQCLPSSPFHQWPDECLIPGFREVAKKYFEQLADLSYAFIALLAEAFGLAPDAFTKFFQHPESIQHRGMFIQYPHVKDDNAMGVAPHYDSGFLIFLL